MSQTLPRPWWETWPAHRPCMFSRPMAEANARILERAFGTAWIRKGLERNDRHPLIDLWRQGGEHAYLNLNVLAEDLRTLEGTPGLEPILKSLRAPREYPGQVFSLHMAALFRRGGNRLGRFFSPSNETVPDFELAFDDSSSACEAKLLTRSQAEADFSHRAGLLQQDVMTGLAGSGVFSEARIVAKDASHLPSASDILAALTGMPQLRNEASAELRSREFNIFLVPASYDGEVADFRSIQILAPSSQKENDRVENLFKKANRQLRCKEDGAAAGVMCLGLGEHQDHRHIVDWATRKFSDGQFSSISTLLMHRPAQLGGPGPGAPLELIGALNNPGARPVPDLRVTGVGILESLDLSPGDSISCYGVAMASGRIVSSTGGFGINPIFRLSRSEVE